MQTDDGFEYTSGSLNACIYYEISVSVEGIIKNDLMMDGLPLTLCQTTFLDSFKMKKLADDIFLNLTKMAENS